MYSIERNVIFSIIVSALYVFRQVENYIYIIIMSVLYVFHRMESYIIILHTYLSSMYFTEWNTQTQPCPQGQTYNAATGTCGESISFILFGFLLHIRGKPVGQIVVLTDSLTALHRIQGDIKCALTLYIVRT